MIFKPDAIVEIEKGLKFIVLDIKKYRESEVALLQGVNDGILRFAVEKIDEKKKSANLVFIDDEKLIKEIAEEFDRQDGK